MNLKKRLFKKRVSPALRHALCGAIGVLVLFSMVCCTGNTRTSEVGKVKPRIVVTCDPELDDNNSLIRFLLYSNEYDVEGLIYASSQVHWKGDGKGTKVFEEGREYARMGLGPQESWRWGEDEHFINDVVDAYGKVYPNLKVHDSNYPAPEYLQSIIRWGNVEFEGDISRETEGSNLIKTLILDDEPGQLFVTAWGGPSTIARALKSIQETYEGTPEWESIKDKVAGKAVLLLSGTQDRSYADYIKPNWPEVEAIITGYSGIGLGYNAQRGTKPEQLFYYEPEWTEANITSKGPLGELYRVWGDGKQMAKGDMTDYFGLSGYTADELRAMGYNVWTAPQSKGSFISEGDTPSFLDFLDNGLYAWKEVGYGGWSGTRRRDNLSTTNPAMPSSRGQASNSGYPEFLPAAQNSFANRLNWSVTPNYEDANHEPIIKGPLAIEAKPGETVTLKTKISDPDDNNVSVTWHQFKVAPYEGIVSADIPNSPETTVVIPEDAKAGDKIHMVLEAVDDGSPALTSYKRVIITIVPNN
jgi:hypothetical protein